MAINRNGRKCNFESLENRRMLAGNVVAKVEKGVIVLKGDNFSNGVVVTAGINPGEFIVTGINQAGNPTSINGIPNDALTLVNVTKGLKANLGRGNDSLTVNGVTLNGKVKIKTGLGIDTVTVNASSLCSDLEIRTGKNADDITVNNTTVGGETKIDGGRACDQVQLTASTFGQLDVALGRGNDDLLVTNINVIVDTTLNGNQGINTFATTNGSFFGSTFTKLNLAGS
jgi:large repetitive protein